MKFSPKDAARAGWVRVSAPGRKLGARWVHPSGWVVSHCGHPTANWPYSAEHPDTAGFVIAAHGHGFRNLAWAFHWIAELLDGRAILSDRVDQVYRGSRVYRIEKNEVAK